MPIVPRNLHTKYGHNTTLDKGVTKQNAFDSDSRLRLVDSDSLNGLIGLTKAVNSFPQTKFFIRNENFIIVLTVPDLIFKFISLGSI